MSVQLTPDGQLGFHRPYTQLVKRTLTVANPNDRPIMFKVKTTAPKQYCVRPNSGRIEPKERLEVQVLLQPMKEDPPLSAKCRDKFLVQSAVIPKERDTLLMTELWQIVEKEERETIHEQKIRCVYLPPNEDEASHGAVANGISPASEAAVLPAHDTPNRSHGAAQSGMSNGDSFQAAQSTIGTPTSPQEPTKALEHLSDAAPQSALAGAAAAAGAAAVSLGLNSDTTTTTEAPAVRDQRGISTSSDADLNKELADARREISRLKVQLADAQSASSLRQRNAASPSEATSSSTAPVIGHDTQLQSVEGVPPKVVMGIALTVFIVTWLFF